ncbi:hypothetical protein GF325_10780 [Candidatus Bathyarchaeota archaeon]|nr:hypothetical protein [Candidatus Bathyarchaeota archaeon]
MPNPNTDSPPHKEQASLHPFEHEEPIQVKQFRVDDLPAGKISTLNVEIVTDALNIPITVPVIVAKGTKPGPVLGLTAALHGNELNGILVIQEFLQSVDPGALKGVIAGVPVVNVPGYLFNQREYFDGFDLNHIMPGKREGKRSEVYAYRLVNRIISQFNHLIDFHTASFGRINSHYVRANLAQVETARMARMQHTQIILHSVARDDCVLPRVLQGSRYLS